MFRTIMLYTLYEPFRDLFSQKVASGDCMSVFVCFCKLSV